MIRCKDCKFWIRDYRYRGEVKVDMIFGSCGCDKFQYDDSESPNEDDILSYWDFEGCSAGFSTGQNFGCIHGEKIERRVEEMAPWFREGSL